jgi:hypothetical protein
VELIVVISILLLLRVNILGSIVVKAPSTVAAVNYLLKKCKTLSIVSSQKLRAIFSLDFAAAAPSFQVRDNRLEEHYLEKSLLWNSQRQARLESN